MESPKLGNQDEKIEQMKNIKTEQIIMILMWIFIFACLSLFFQVFHPLTVFDADDWTYVKFLRRSGGIFPSTKEWNPIKILPENMMPTAGFFGAYIIRPIIGDYVRPLEISLSLFLCITILVYFYLIIKALDVKFDLSMSEKMIMIVFVIFLHFLPFITKDENNKHLFHALNTTCIYNYTIPVLFNAITICYSIIFEKIMYSGNFKNHKRVNVFYLVLIYLSINSNLFGSIIIAVFALFKLIQSIMETKKLLVNNTRYFFVLFMWIGSLLLEYNGDRAKTVGKTGMDAFGSIVQFLANAKTTNPFYIMMIGFLIIFGIILVIRNKDYKQYRCFLFALLGCGALTLIYEILLSAKTSCEYLSRPEVRFSYLFYIMFAAYISVIILIRDLQSGKILMGIVTVVMAFFVVCGKQTYADVNYYMYPYEKCNEISDYIISQYMDAYENGEKSAEIKVPVCGDGDVNEFPFADYGASRISSALWWHGMTDYKIDAIFVPDKNVNDKFGM